MGGLAHFIEDEGIATTQISLVRLHSEKMRPPRALWVPFELGRPLGAPGDADFQLRVLRRTLALFERADGPVILEDYDEEAPADVAADEGEGWACPVNLPPPPVDLEAGGGFKAALLGEIQRLMPWYDMTVKERGRTAVGLSGFDLPEAADYVCRFFDEEMPDNPRDDLPLSDTLRFAIDDLKAFYREAANAQPGSNTGLAIADWFYGETVAGRMLFALRPIVMARGKATEDAGMARYGAALLIPQSQRHRGDLP